MVYAIVLQVTSIYKRIRSSIFKAVRLLTSSQRTFSKSVEPLSLHIAYFFSSNTFAPGMSAKLPYW